MDKTILEENNLFDGENNDERTLEDEANIDNENGKKKKKKKKEISYKQEILRKLIHLCSLSIPITYIFVSQELALTILIPMAILMVATDLATKLIKPLNRLYKKFFGKMLRKHEKKKKRILLNGASWVLISAVLTVAVFPKIIAVTGFTILIVSDIFAALIGRKYGKTPLFNKSWEGTTAFMVSAIIAVAIIGYSLSMPWTYFVFGAIAAIVGAFAEAASKVLKADDNLTIPISVGIVMWLGELLAMYLNVPFTNIL